MPAALLPLGQLEVWVPTFHEPNAGIGPRWVFSVQILCCCGLLLWRRFYPLSVLVGVCAVLAVTVPFGWLLRSQVEVLLLVIVVFAAGRYASRPAAYVALLLAPVLVVAWAIVDPAAPVATSWAWGLNSLWIFALGAWLRHEDEMRTKVVDAAAMAARAEAMESRLDVARDVHDVVSHSLVIVVLQAELAQLHLDTAPDKARAAIEQVAVTARAALGETRDLVDLLRDPDRPAAESPALTIDDVPALIHRMSESGLPVTLSLPPSVPAVTDEVSATAYRVIQEALTNVMRHAGKVPTTVEVHPNPSGIVIDVLDQGTLPDPAIDTGGHGLRGMRERVLACGGELSATAEPDGGFRVRAVLPVVGAR